MNCKKCGRELRAGAQRCPYCGTVVPAPGRQTGTGFNWELKESSGSANSRPREKKSDQTFNWNTDRSVNTKTGRNSFREGNRWKEPEEARQLFTFDKEHEKLQRQVDWKVDTIAAEKPAPAIERERRDDLFVLPSDMTMDDFSDLLGDSIVKESDSVLVVNRQVPSTKSPAQPRRQTSPARQANQGLKALETGEAVRRQPVPERERPVVVFPPPEPVPSPYIPAETKPSEPVIPVIAVPEQREVQNTRPQKKRKPRSPEDQAYDPFEGQAILRAPEMPAFLSRIRTQTEPSLSFDSEPKTADNTVSDSALGSLRNLMGNASSEEVTEERGPSLTAIDPGYTPEEEKRAIENFQNLIDAEEEFSESVARFTFMSEEESKKADQAWQRWEKLSNEPKITFQSLEEEYRESKENKELSPEHGENVPSTEEETVTIPAGESEEGEITVEEGSVSSETGEEKRTDKSGETETESESEGNREDEVSETAASGGRVRKAVDMVRKTAGRAAAMAEESVKSLVSEEDEEVLDRGVFTGLSLSMEEPENSASGKTDSYRKNKKKPRELNIRINEPTGTQVKVRTEEVELSEQAVNLKDTQQVDFGKLKEGPKSVKVQVEVNHTSSSSSVEVTRSNDGSTVVKTVEGGTEKEHLYDASGEDLLYRRTEDESFWGKNEVPATKMTIADIYSPEMLEFAEKWEDEEEQRRAEGLETVVRAPDLSSEEAMEQFLASELEEKEELAESENEEIVEPAGTDDVQEKSEVETETSTEEIAEELTEGSADGIDLETDVVDTEADNTLEEETEANVEETVDDSETPEISEAEAQETTDLQGQPEEAPDEVSESLEKPTLPENENNTPYEDLGVVIPSVHDSEKIEEETEPEDTDQDDHPVQVSEEGRFKRAGKINFNYKKTRSKPEELPVEADREPEEALPGFSEETMNEKTEEVTEDGELQGLFNSLTNIRNRISEAIGTGESEDDHVHSEADEDKSTKKAISETVEEPADGVPEEKETRRKEEGRWSAASIMKIVIYILLVAIVIEFAVIGTKLFFPNSQGAVLIHRIEQTISGEDILSTISVDSYALDGAEVELPDLDQPEG